MSEFGPKRAQYLGRFAANPTPAQEGQWWYNTTDNCFWIYEGNETRRFAMAYKANDGDFVIPVGGGCTSGTISIITLGTIVAVVSLTVTETDPSVCDVYAPQMVSLSGTTVGITIGGVTGTTVTVRALAVGPIY